MPEPTEPSDIVYEPPDPERPASSSPALNADVTPHDPYLALRYKDFRFYGIGWLTAVVGEQMLELAVGWDLFGRTHKPMVLGWVGLVSALPVIILALPAGHLADRMDRRRIVMFTQICWAICAVALGIVSHYRGPVNLVYLLLFAAAVAKATGAPARSALLPIVVPSEVFANAVAWNSSGYQLSSMLGPALGGLIIMFSVPSAYICAAAGAIVFMIFLSQLNTRQVEQHKQPATLKSLAAGVHFVWSTKIILATITLDLFAVLLGGAVYLLPAFAQLYLNVGAVGFGWMRAAPAIGALVMAIFVAHLPPMKHAGRSMLLAVAGFGAATIVFGYSSNYWLSLAMLFLTGAFDNISVVVRHTLVQVLTPDAMRGRVSAVNNVFIGASNELGGFESGLTAKMWGTRTSVVVGGIGTIVVVGLVAAIWPQLRKFGSLVGHAHEDQDESKRGFEALPVSKST